MVNQIISGNAIFKSDGAEKTLKLKNRVLHKEVLKFCIFNGEPRSIILWTKDPILSSKDTIHPNEDPPVLIRTPVYLLNSQRLHVQLALGWRSRYSTGLHTVRHSRWQVAVRDLEEAAVLV